VVEKRLIKKKVDNANRRIMKIASDLTRSKEEMNENIQIHNRRAIALKEAEENCKTYKNKYFELKKLKEQWEAHQKELK